MGGESAVGFGMELVIVRSLDRLGMTCQCHFKSRRREWNPALVSLKTDMLERWKAPVVEGQGESGAALQAKSPTRR